MPCHQFQPTFTRRDLLRTSACGFGQLALSALLAREGRADARLGPGAALSGRRFAFENHDCRAACPHKAVAPPVKGT